MNSLNDPIIEVPGMGSTNMSSIDFNSLNKDQIQAIIKQAPQNPSVLQYLLDAPDGNSEAMRNIKEACKKAVSMKPSGPMARAKRGDMPTREEALALNRMINRRVNNSGYKGVFFTRNKKIKTITLTSTNNDFFTKNLMGEVDYEIIDGDIIIAYSLSGRKKNPDVRKYLAKYNLHFIDQIKESAIVYSMTRDITLDML